MAFGQGWVVETVGGIVGHAELFHDAADEVWGTRDSTRPRARPVWLADAHFVSRPEGAHGIVVDYWFSVALDFDYSGGLVGGLERKAG